MSRTMPPPIAIGSDDARLEDASVWCARLADGHMSPEEQTAFDAWIAQPANREAFDRAAGTWQAFEAVAAAPELIVMRGQALESVRRANRGRWARAVRRGPVIGIAASLALAVVAGGAWLHFAPKAYVTGVGERRVVALADGSKLSLDAATEVDVRYLADRRQLWLKRGRAKFAVAKDPLRPFSVAAADKVVVATGTEFSVELLRKQVHVVLYQGHVSVLDAARYGGEARPVGLASARVAEGSKPPSADQALTPGRELIASVDAPQAQVIASDPARSLSWEAGQLVFNNEPLASAVERVNRYSDEKVAVDDPAAANVLVSGVFTAGDTNAFVIGITAVFPVRVVEAEGARRFVSLRR